VLKICTKCKKRRQILFFYKDKTKPDGLDAWCANCRINYRKVNKKEIIKRRKPKLRDEQLKYVYGITRNEYNTMYKNQKAKCGICKLHEKHFTRILCVDHCHITGKIRGLLCHKCNAALGAFRDNIDILKNAIKWLE